MRKCRGFKKITAAFLALLMMFSGVVIAAADETSTQPWLLPVRATFEDFGATDITWHEENKSIHISLDYAEIMLAEGRLYAYVNDTRVTMFDGFAIIGGTAFITERDFFVVMLSAFGYDIATLHLTDEARDLALQDFDFMVEFVLDNSPWDSVIYRSLGIVFEEHTAKIRSLIENKTTLHLPAHDEIFPIRAEDDARSLAANYLSYLLLWGFSYPLQGLGHLFPQDAPTFALMFESLQRALSEEDMHEYERDFITLVIGAHSDPAAIWFYGEPEIDFEDESHHFPEIPGNISTEIIIPGHIAYMRIDTFMSNPEYDAQFIFPFLYDIEEYDHFILDLRGNAGGLMSYFDNLILLPLMSEPGEINSFQFFSSGEAVMGVMQAFLDYLTLFEVNEDSWRNTTYFNIRPAHEVILEMELTYFDEDDLSKLEHVLITRETFTPIPAEYRFDFNGQIWLLVDENSASASVDAAIVSMALEFAIVVGENTAGVTGVLHTYTVLPNTGIVWRVDLGYITDDYGRSLEVYGLTPQILNLPDKDALETVMTLILQGDY